MISRRRSVPAQGKLRRSQLLTTFGPGAMLDMPEHSVLVGGLDHWSGVSDEILEPRLLEKVCIALDRPGLRLMVPPRAMDEPDGGTGVIVWQFPEWFVTQEAFPAGDGARIRSRQLVHRQALTGRHWIDEDRKKRTVVPVRFVRACLFGHIGDIDWRAFVHGQEAPCNRQGMWVDELGTSGDITEILIRCACGRRRQLSEAVGWSSKALGLCDGARPWLGPGSRERCTQHSRLLIRNASNAWFPQNISVISLPPRNETVKRAVESAWEFLEACESAEDVQRERKKARVREVIADFSNDEIWEEIQAVRSGETGATSVKQAELETLMAVREEGLNVLGKDDFHATRLPRSEWDSPWTRGIEQVVLVHRLREVTAQVGFTRFDSAAADIDGELDAGVQRAELATNLAWVPAIENRGEGIFIQFSRESMDAWLARPGVREYSRRLSNGFDRWKAEHRTSRREFPGLPYYMLHSFSHLLITAVSLECGYPASSIKERIYSFPGIGYGVLIFTSSPDAEGTLGGLIEAGRRIGEHVRNGLVSGTLCSNDPVCSCHSPEETREARYLHGSACHGCLLIAETSCEQHNQLLDRNLVIPTLARCGVSFFDEPGGA